jgi:hypothetical protein
MNVPDLTNEDRTDLARFLREAIDADRWPLSYRPACSGSGGASGEARSRIGQARERAVSASEASGAAQRGSGDDERPAPLIRL